MRIALLVCDHVAKPFVEVHGDYLFMFERLLGSSLQPYFVCDNHFPDPDDYEAFIVTGSKLSVYDEDPWIRKLIDFTTEIAKSNKRFIGICFGHQVIGEALGGKVEKAAGGYLIGVHEHIVSRPAAWMDPAAGSFNVLMLCQDQISKLPPDTLVHASSSECPNGMISIRNQFFGIQGHPEFTKAYNQDVFTSRMGKIGTGKVEKAIDSLEKEIHTDLLSRWIKNFLNP